MEGTWLFTLSILKIGFTHFNSQDRPTMFQKLDYFFLVAAFASFLGSVGLWFLVNHDYGAYVGIWVPSILSLWVGVRVVLLSGATTHKKNN